LPHARRRVPGRTQFASAGRVIRNEQQPDESVNIAGVEFRYDSLRGRYRSRAANTGSSANPTEWTYGDALWTADDGDEPYLDFTASIEGKSIATAPTMRYTGAAGTFVQQSLDALGDPVSTRYYHADLVGSTRVLTDEGGSIISGAAPADLTYAAFGRRLPFATPGEYPTPPTPIGTRYGFAGAHGYQDDALAGTGPQDWRATGLLHLGARYYQPDLGRFVMRDPIGIWGGGNVYSYGNSRPTNCVDPSGTFGGAVSMTASMGIQSSLRVCEFAVHVLVYTYVMDAIQTSSTSFNWTSSIGEAAGALGESPRDIKRAIHSIKNKPGYEGNPDVEIDTDTGDVRIGDEDYGNIKDELDNIGRCD
ncbi:MAG: RHS repeat-associated core domain-containing protein, partial [Phycisphaerae bacterium]